MAKNIARLAIRMVSMAGTGFEYITMKNPKNTTWKLRLVKYDPVVQQRVLFKVRAHNFLRSTSLLPFVHDRSSLFMFLSSGRKTQPKKGPQAHPLIALCPDLITRVWSRTCHITAFLIHSGFDFIFLCRKEWEGKLFGFLGVGGKEYVI